MRRVVLAFAAATLLSGCSTPASPHRGPVPETTNSEASHTARAQRSPAKPPARLVFKASAARLSETVRREVVAAHEWHAGCPVPLSGLRVLKLRYWGFDGRAHWGQLVVNAGAVGPLGIAFRRLYALRFPIHHMALSDEYGPPSGRPGDVTASFECRQAVPSPCTGGTATGHWSEHAYGEAVDLNPVENPYVGCGMTRDKQALQYVDRSRVRPGMVTPAVVAAFGAAGWGWGGSWSDSKDYMHFSASGH
jgi:hypothetical protein